MALENGLVKVEDVCLPQGTLISVSAKTEPDHEIPKEQMECEMACDEVKIKTEPDYRRVNGKVEEEIVTNSASVTIKEEPPDFEPMETKLESELVLEEDIEDNPSFIEKEGTIPPVPTKEEDPLFISDEMNGSSEDAISDDRDSSPCGKRCRTDLLDTDNMSGPRGTFYEVIDITSKNHFSREEDQSFKVPISTIERSNNQTESSNVQIFGDKLYSCSLCSEKFNSKSHLQQHASLHNLMPFICKLCNAHYKFESNLSRHYATHHDGKSPNITETCSGNELKQSSEIPVSADVAKGSDKQRGDHETPTAAVSKQHACTLCPKKFKWESLLKRHISTHSGEKPFSCKLCTAGFKTKLGLHHHILAHSVHEVEGSNHLTENCSTFQLTQLLNQHSVLKSFSCQQCEACFATRSGLECHMQTHDDPKTFPPTKKSAQLKPKNHRRHHSASHIKDSFICKQCFATFGHRNNLREHLVSHSDSKPFGCMQCTAQFKTRRALKQHLTTHSDAKPYSCKLCPRMFKYTRSLRKHLLSHSHDSQGRGKVQDQHSYNV